MTKIVSLEEWKKAKKISQADEELYCKFSNDSLRWSKKLAVAYEWGERYAMLQTGGKIPTKKLKKLPSIYEKEDCLLYVNTDLIAIFPAKGKAYLFDNPEYLKKSSPYAYVQFLRMGVLRYLINKRPDEYNRLFC